jgi:tetratricopeptide (TPR) repeat protein
MPRLQRLALSIVSIASIVSITGCATTDPNRPTSLQTSMKPAWAAKATPDDMIVSVSPAGKTLRLAGSAGIILGTGADAVVNAKYRAPIHAALEGYNPAEVFADIIEVRLEAAMNKDIERVAPLGSTAGMNSRQDAVEGRYEGLGKSGYDTLLDLVMTYGIYGSSGTLATKLDGKLVTIPDGKTLWDDVLIVTHEPVFANAKLGNPTKRGGYNVTNPEFTVDEDEVNRWTADGGAILKERFEMAAQDATSALLCALGLEDNNAAGHYALGELAMNRKDFEEAAGHLEKAAQLDPGNPNIKNTYSVNLAHNKQIDTAIRIAKEVTESHPDFGPAWFNIAWWYAVEKDDPGAAATYYEKAKSLGMPEDKKIDKKLRKS